MRVSDVSGPLKGLAIAGNHVVLFGWDISSEQIKSLKVLGFAISRERKSDGERIWLPGMKTFESVDPTPDPGVPVSSFKHPLQTFQWADYSASPDEHYHYQVVARTGTATSLVSGPTLNFDIKTQPVDQGRHAIFFNRGSIASQEYARRFQNMRPDDVGQAAFDWLSRGLIEGLEKYIAGAGNGDSLNGAFFEFKNKRIYEALKQAEAKGVTIKVIYDGDSQGDKNRTAMRGAGIGQLVKPREHAGNFAHNKFLVLSRSAKAEEVWTGSTNLSQNGIFGHSNNAHIVRDAPIAESYLKYWRILNDDKTLSPTAQAVEAENPGPPQQLTNEITPLFSPRKSLDVLDWYASLADAESKPLFATFAFGMNNRFVDVYSKQDGILRFALMEKKGNGKTIKQQSAQIDALRKLPNVVVSVGNKVELNTFDRWLAEIDQVSDEAHVLYIHTKYMLIDPLGTSPTVIMGSANFSDGSTNKNDENMLVINDNKDVADIYIGEFMRLFTHYSFRESLKFKQVKTGTSPKRKYLREDTTWINGERAGSGYYDAGGDRALKRAYFSTLQ
jgi:phosphatidylserine/phosphatidylglycerophosphate/cardiolipin synthase-like enzyme